MVSVKEKASLKGSGRNQGDERKRSIDEVSKSGYVVKTGLLYWVQDKFRGSLLTA